MAYKKDVNIWFQQFQHIMREQGIDINNKNDIQRLRVPGPNQQGSEPLFPQGFSSNPESVEKLHQLAEQGNLFFFQKNTNAPVQITANADNSLSAYSIDEVRGCPPMEEVPIWYTALNVVTLGITDAIFGRRKEYKEQMKEFRDNNVEQLSFWKKAINVLSFGNIFGENLIEQNNMETRQAIARGKAANLLTGEKAVWDKRSMEEKRAAAEKRKAQRRLQKQERMKSMIKDVMEAQNQPKKAEQTKQTKQDVTSGGDYESPAAKGNMLKSQLAENYELMKDAFGPNGGGWGTIMKAVNHMDRIAKELKSSPELMEKAVMSEKKCQRAENLCTAIRTIARDGMDAKGKLMAADSGNLTKEERENYIRSAVKMDLLQNTLQNSAYAKANTKDAEAVSRTSRLINNMRKDPAQSGKDMDRVVDSMNVVDKLMEMSPEDLAIYLQNPDQIRKDIQSSMREKVQQQENSKERQQERQIQKQKEVEQPQEVKQQEINKTA